MARLIDADALVKDIDKEIDEEIKSPLSDNHKFFFCAGMRYVVRLVKRLPTVDHVKHGHWEFYSGEECYIICSECRKEYYCDKQEMPNYCPNCGARMIQ